MSEAAIETIEIDEYEDFPLDGEGAAPAKSHLDIEAALTGVIVKLQGLADQQVQLKQTIEQRWLDDLRQFHGRYSVKLEADLAKAEKSSLFVNLTRSKVNSWEARLSDLLFPTDDKNWGIKPTPAPHLVEGALQAIRAAKDAAEKATQAHQQGDTEGGAQIAEQGNIAADHANSLQEEMDEAVKRAGLMEAEIETQLRVSDYNIRCRGVIRDMVKLGSGVMKGPVTSNRLRRSWKLVGTPANDATAQPDPVTPTPVTDLRAWKGQGGAAPTPQGQTGGAYQLDTQPDPAPEFVWIDPWSYFPDMSARTVEEAEFHFERHLWNAKQLRAAVKAAGLDPKAVADLLRETPRESVPTYWTSLREITANTTTFGLDKRYQVWEFHGVLEDEDLMAIAEATGDQSVLEFVQDNPLLEVPVILWFCQGKLLKVAPHPLDSCESMYSVVSFEPDDTSLFGFGVPYLLRDPQSAINGAWRMVMDNGGLAVGPQIVIDNDAIKPADGSWTIRPMKVWLKSSTSLTKAPDSYRPFETFAVAANQTPLQTIITLARQFADDETNMPLIAAGDMGSHISKTSSGMSMLMNSANVVFRRVVKNFDDRISTPNIRRIYDWNMQFSKRDDIKGDFDIDARGSSVLLVKEMQAQAIMATLMNFSNHPIIGPLLRVPQLTRQLFKAQMIHADEAVKDDDTIAKEAEIRAQQAAKNPQPATAYDPEVIKANNESREKIAQERDATALKIAELNQETAMMTLAEQRNMSLEDLQQRLAIVRAGFEHKERMMAVELAHPPAQHIGGAEFETPGASNA